jgi:hypothetical protein
MSSHHGKSPNHKGQGQGLIGYRAQLRQQARFANGPGSDLIRLVQACQGFLLNAKKAKLAR